MSQEVTNLGFLTILHETTGYLGGYLVTNDWGRPLEFRLSSAVQPNKVQQILYGPTLVPYVCADLIGKTLVDKAGSPVRLVFTDREEVLDLRLKLEVPVVWLAPMEDTYAADAPHLILPPGTRRGPIYGHPRFTAEVETVREHLKKIESTIDLTEPFARIREALAEARKMGVTNRSAA